MSRAKIFAAILTFFVCVPAFELAWGGGSTTAFLGATTVISTGAFTLSSPELMAVDGLGNLYIADKSDNQIVEVTATGVPSVVSFPGLSPSLAHPTAVAVDAAGDIYVADSSNARVVKLSAGVASLVNTASLLSNPAGVAVDIAGDLYISDATNNYIVKVLAGGSAAVLSISGLGATPLLQPFGVAVDASGNLYIADSSDTVIITDSSTGNFGVVRMPGFTLSGAQGVAVSVWGSVYIADTGNNRILEAQPAAVGFGHLQYGAVSGTTLTLNFMIGSSVTFGSVQAFTQGAPALDFTVTATTCVSGTTTNAACTVNIQFLPTAAGFRKGTVVLYSNATPAVPILSIPVYGMVDAPLATLSPGAASVISTGGVSTETPFQIAEDGAGNLYVADYEGNNVLKVPPGGGSATVVSLGEELTTSEVAGVVLDGTGDLFITDHFDSRIIEVTPGGVASALSITGLSTGLEIPTGLAVDAANNLYISDYGNSRVVKVTPSGAGSVVATPGFTPAALSVLGVAVDQAGTVYFPDAENNRVIKVTAAGVASLVVPEGLTPVLSSPQGVAVDGFGNLYIADAGNDRLVKVTAAGVASVVPTPGLASPPTLGTFFAIAVDSSGNILVPDFGNSRLVKVNLSSAALAFPNTDVGSTSTPQTATVTNIGDQPLVFYANLAYTANFPENTGDENLCASTTSLAAGEVCDVSVEFAPQSVGSLSANITLTNNNLNGSNATENVAVSGTGLITSTTTALTASPNPAIAGQSVTLTATVSPVPTGSSLGTVSFFNGATLLGSGNVNSSGVATLSTASLPVGADSLTAVYSGNTDFATSTSIIFTETIAALTSTTTTLTAAPNPANVGESVTLTATISPAPTEQSRQALVVREESESLGTVSFYYGETLLGSGNVNSSGLATSSTTTLPAGADGLTAVYSGDASFAASTSSVYTETITVPTTATATTLTASPNPGTIGQSVTMTATVSPAPTGSSLGTVSFYNGATLLGNGNVNSSGVATFSTASLPAGADSLTAVYSGNAGFVTSTSSALTETVVAAAVTTSTTLTASPDPAFDDQPVTLTATVSPTPTGSPAGTVSFYSGTTLLGTGTLNASGVATLTTSSLVVGSDSITAAYAGNAGFAASTSSALSLTVATSFTVSAPPVPVPVAEGGTATIDLTVPPLGGAFNSVVTLSASGLPAGATATFNPPTVTPGSAGAPTVMTIQLATLAAGVPASDIPANRRGLPAAPFALVLGMFGTVFSAVVGRKRISRSLMPVLLLTTLGVTACGLTSCNGGFETTPQTTAGNYTITVTGTSGAFEASTTVTLTVQ